MRKLRYISLALFGLALLAARNAQAQTGLEKLQVKARVGYSIGGTAPIGVPATIRRIFVVGEIRPADSPAL